MTRLLTLIATGLWVAPICALAAFGITVKLLEKSPGQGGDMAGAAIGGLGIVAGLAAGAAGFGLAVVLVLTKVPAHKFVHLQIADGVILLSMVIGWMVWQGKTADQPPLRYDGSDALLELELRAPKDKLRGAAMNEIVRATFWGGQGADVAHPENLREEGEFTILPVTIHLIQAKKWLIRVSPQGPLEKAALFTLDLPLRPEKSTEWSGWMQSTANEEYETAEWLTLRYRFRLAPRK